MIHPRRLKGTSRNIARYYTVGDYYTKGGDEPSSWGGKIAEELGLSGQVDPKIFHALLAGEVAGQQLGRHRGDGEIHHHPGWDFAVNAPKSVSIMALVAGDERIVAAHELAVTTALAYLEEHAALRHRSEGGIVQQTTGRLIFARFTEHASRELDPHLHTHVVVMNITNRDGGGQMASLETRAMFAEQMVAGQIYRNELAHHLQEAGYAIEADPRKGLFEIRGVPADLVREMSTRAAQIDAHASEHGLTGQAGRQRSFYATRGPKAKASIESLHERWRDRAAIHVTALEETRNAALENAQARPDPDAATSARAMLFGIRQAETGEAVNNLGRMFRLALASHLGEVRLQDIRPLSEAHEERAKLLATRFETGDDPHSRGRTTRRTARLERALSEQLSLSLGDASAIASAEQVGESLPRAGLNPAQEAALLHAATTADRVTGIHGVAGAGKSTLVKALRDIADPAMTFIALAPTSSAAAELGARAGIASRTVASLMASGGRSLDESHVLVLDEAGQLGNRQALRVLEISRLTGARLILLGDNKQTGAIEQGKAFWLLQRLGLPTAQLTESVRQETRQMKAAVTQARLADYAASLDNLDKVVDGSNADALASGLVAEWTRLSPASRAKTDILVLENTTRLIVNAKIREALKIEGGLAAQETRLAVLVPTGMTDQEKRLARFYSGGQIVTFSRGIAGLGIIRDAEYRVVGTAHDASGRPIVELADENGRRIGWDPRIGRVARVNVFQTDQRDLAPGDRIQWRLVNHELGLKNAERGSVEKLEGMIATVRWDRDGRVQDIDLSRQKSWDHGYAETVYSAQSKTFDRAYVLAPVNSPLVTGQNYYTAITRARLGVKLWTEDRARLIDKLVRRSGQKTSALEGLGRLDRDSHLGRMGRHGERWEGLREHQRADRLVRAERLRVDRERFGNHHTVGVAYRLAERARSAAEMIDRWLGRLTVQTASQRDHAHDVQLPQPPQQPRHDR